MGKMQYVFDKIAEKPVIGDLASLFGGKEDRLQNKELTYFQLFRDD
jgi:hypothetical protein